VSRRHVVPELTRPRQCYIAPNIQHAANICYLTYLFIYFEKVFYVLSQLIKAKNLAGNNQLHGQSPNVQNYN